MQDAVFIAIIGLLALIPLEIVFFIVLAALKKRVPAASTIVFPEPKRQERYGWEDYLKLSHKEKREPGSGMALVILVVAAMLILIAVPSYLFGIPQFILNNATNETVVEPPIVEEPEVGAASPSNFSLNITFPSLNFSMHKLNTSGLREKAGLYKPYIYSVIVAVVILAAALAAFVYVVNRRKMAVIQKAMKTVDKLMKNGGKSEKSWLRNSVSRLSGIRPHLAPLVILFLLVVIALLVYLLRDRIRTELADSVLSALISLKVFALNYRLYIAAGVVALIVAIMALRRSKKKQK